MPADARPSPFKKSVAREYLESLVVAFILATFIRTFVVQAFKIPTGSMENNLLIGDHLLVNKVVYSPSLGAAEDALMGKKPIQRGHVVVFKYPDDPPRDFIKRVIGLPGETIEIRSKQVFIDGKPLDEPYVHFLEPPLRPEDPEYGIRFDGGRGDDYGPRTVPEGQLFVHGRQPRQQQGQPLLGLPARRPGEGPRADGVLVLRGLARGVPSHRLLGMGAGHVRRLRQDPLAALLPSHPLKRSGDMRPTGDTERGEGRLGSIIGLVVFAAIVLAAWNVTPIFIADYTFADKLNEFARMSRYQHSDDRIMELVMREASKQRIDTYLGGRTGCKIVTRETSRTIDCAYKREVEILPGWKHTFNFTPKADQPLI